LINYDKDNIPDSTIQKVAPIMENPEMAADKITAVSLALAPVRVWIVAMLKYHETLKIVNPLREKAAEMGEKLAVVQAALAEKRAKVKAIMDNLQELTDEQNMLTAKAEKLAFDLDECKKKMVRANKMIEGLAGEKERWTSTVA
jgi:dynein heavy chain